MDMHHTTTLRLVTEPRGRATVALSGWTLHIYEMSDTEAQHIVGAVLSGMDGLTVESAERDDACFLIVDCQTRAQAASVRQIVTSIDPRAVLHHTAIGPAEISVPA